MRKVKVSAIQIQVSNCLEDNLNKVEAKIREAAQNGANIILLPELFERQYFCQERRYEYYAYAKETLDNDAVKMALELSMELNILILVSFYELSGNCTYNTLAYVEDGKLLGTYRKTHIPDDHYYQEKFYFTPGNTGFKVFDTKYGRIGAGICWDQWFPETARCLALNGAELIFFPTAIGSEPILNVDSSSHWQRVMMGHAAANIVPVIAANRIGLETVEPSVENGNQSSSLNFYGSSFMADERGEIVVSASRDKEEILYHEYDLDKIREDRLAWGLFRDRRPETYKIMVE
ncbi:MAG: N-carbamoylputrescine amidase [Solobacterium sp.]|nr:N-carbamoylputrescine amidase [Solobacterium sp.]MCI6877252.1 N-carbamoylputrescine amidase [Solobacterium sp.]MCI7156280.1 N-carbamoylputrescine amidase [Solobacterium sp.]MDY5402633.1 N-carbamoylputrescine amidase [Erysipelotrichaceae bacterium]